MRISIIIPTKDRPHKVKKLLNQLQAINYFPVMAAELEFYLFFQM